MKFKTKFFVRKSREEDDLGFGTKIVSEAGRLINKDGSYNIVRNGVRSFSPYQSLVEMHWTPFWFWVLVAYVSCNIFFALLFVAAGVEQISGLAPQDFLHNFTYAFFFSVQTFTTVGYGAMSPAGMGAQIIAAVCALIGLVTFALMTGLFFAKFAKPKAQIIFSKNAIIAPFREGKAFMFRIANLRNNKIINLKARLIMTWVEENPKGKIRRYVPLSLDRDSVMMFPLNWTLVHPINEESPIFEKSLEDIRDSEVEFLVLVEGHDETYNQSVYTTSSYEHHELLWGYSFLPMYHTDANGMTILHLDRIDEVVKVEGIV